MAVGHVDPGHDPRRGDDAAVILLIIAAVVVLALLGLAIHDLVQTHHSVLRTYPVIGHLRYVLESFGPETRQYLVTDNDEERPFSRDQRRWIYCSAKGTDTSFGFGTDNHLETIRDYLIVDHAAFPLGLGAAQPDPSCGVPGAKVLGARARPHDGLPAAAGERVGHELRRAQRSGHRVHRPGCGDGRVPAQHG